jgi:hypothetical protein
MRKFLIKLILGGVALGAATAWAAWDRTANYEPVTAEVTKVEEVCYMKKTERGIASKTTTTTKEGPCPIITALNQTHPEYQDFDLVKVTTVEFRYRSPADGKVHRGKQREENRRETGLKLRRGDDLVVLAHKTKPEETRKY